MEGVGGEMKKKNKKTKKIKISASRTAKNPGIQFETTKGSFVVELFSDVSITTQNFLDLVSSGFYDNLIFHRHVPHFVIQGGDPTGTGTGGSGKNIPLEITGHKHVKGALGMARSQDPDSASSQFYICLADTPHLDGAYTVFGQVVDGIDKVLELGKGDKMIKVSLLKKTSDE
jgi:cyclophilin family peptidyl-prolyl cis-trans isomerase